MMPVITFLTDYGLADDFVGVCHGVIATIAPEARVIDLTHGVPRHAVLPGAVLLRGALPYMPAGIHLAVVDPGVGSGRRAVALRTAADPPRWLVGPDNGLLMLAADRFGGVVEAVDVARSPVRLQPVSVTFHGRDLFAPVAAHLARGVALGELGEPLDPAALVRLDVPEPQIAAGELRAHVVLVDGFGNAQLDVAHGELPQTGLRLGRPVTVVTATGRRAAHVGHTFADVGHGELLVYEDAHRMLALAVGHGSAARELGIAPGDEVRILAAR